VQQDGGVVVNDSDVGHELLSETPDRNQTRPTVRHRLPRGKTRWAGRIQLRDKCTKQKLNELSANTLKTIIVNVVKVVRCVPERAGLRPSATAASPAVRQ
jgi:hypothetical protein